MINHIRTLLLNATRGGYGPSYPGEVFVPSSFRPRRLTPAALLARHAIFGTRPDRLFLNYRLHQIMSLLHSALEEYVLADDDRTSYLRPDDFPELFAGAFGIAVTPRNNAVALHVIGAAICDDVAGVCERVWQVRISGDEVTVTPRGASPVVATATFVDNLSNAIGLPASELAVRFAATTDAAWEVLARARPQLDLGVVIAAAEARLGDRVMEFFDDTPVGNSLRNIWMQHPWSPHRYAAMLLGLARSIDQMPPEAV